MGSDSAILCYRGDALTVEQLAALFAGVVRGKLGDTTLAVAHRVAALQPKRGAPAHVLVALEELGRHRFQVASESELAALQAKAARPGTSLADLVRMSWQQTMKAVRENRSVDTRPLAPESTLADDWLVEVAAALSMDGRDVLYAVSSDHGSSGEYAICRGGRRVAQRELGADHEREIDRLLRELTGVDAAHIHALAELDTATVYLLAERGTLLPRPRPIRDLARFEPVPC